MTLATAQLLAPQTIRKAISQLELPGTSLQTLMGWPEPGYAHHHLLTDDSGRRLAKRDRAATLRAMREAGVAPAEILARFTA